MIDLILFLSVLMGIDQHWIFIGHYLHKRSPVANNVTQQYILTAMGKNE